MARPLNKLLVVQAAALGFDFLTRQRGAGVDGLSFRPLGPVFPAVTCTAQASFRTASPPARHGMVANGFYHRDLNRALFWEQSAALVAGPRIWEDFRRRGKRVALLFWQQSLGEDVDIVLSPAPIHKHGGGMVDSVYSRPAGLYPHFCRQVGRRFRLHTYWGPLASARSSDWIARATVALLADPEHAPDLCLTYLPALDYDLQRFGPDARQSRAALDQLLGQLALLRRTAAECGYDMVVFGDYAIGPVSRTVHPNRALHGAGLLATRDIAGRLYADTHASRAFAVVDHEVAHVYIRDDRDTARVREVLAALPGVAAVLDETGKHAAGVDHARSGSLLLTAAPDAWFAYPWWTDPRQAPDYAGHVDIHNKPGYDPCELFFGWPPGTVSQDCSRIRGSHGRVGPDRQTCWASTCPLGSEPTTLIDLASAVRHRLEETT